MPVATDDSGELCPYCGAKMVEYRHRLNDPLVTSLARLRQAGGGPISLKALGLTRNQWDNFQKLRYFDLVRQVWVDGSRKRGIWEITNSGRAFLDGRLAVHRSVWTYRGERVRWDGELVTVMAVAGGYQFREEWAEEAQPHPPRDTLFDF
jgi:hypothetical protein